jgi:hypothetical protein
VLAFISQATQADAADRVLAQIEERMIDMRQSIWQESQELGNVVDRPVWAGSMTAIKSCSGGVSGLSQVNKAGILID